MLGHHDLETIDDAEAWELLASTPIARVGVAMDGRVDVLPVNHCVLADRRVAWLSGTGTKLANAADEGAVALETDAVDPETRTGWSVLVHGTARIVTDPELEQRLYAEQNEPWASPDQRVLWIEVADPVISGRRLR